MALPTCITLHTVIKTFPSKTGVDNTLISIAQLIDLTAWELEGSVILVTVTF